MSLESLNLLAQQTAQDSRASLLQLGGMILIMGFMFYFAILRPQQKKQKEHDKLLKSLKAGDKVVTSGGVCGVVVSVKDKTISMRSSDSKLEILKSAVSEVIERADAGSAS